MVNEHAEVINCVMFAFHSEMVGADEYSERLPKPSVLDMQEAARC